MPRKRKARTRGNRHGPASAKRKRGQATRPLPEGRVVTERRLRSSEVAWPEKSKAEVDGEAARGAVQVHADEGNEASGLRFRLLSQAKAGLTQLVEYHPSKVAVDGSSPLARSTSSLVRPK